MSDRDYVKIIKKLNVILENQGQSGNWDYDEYMHGMYNGMEFILSCIEGREFNYKDAPSVWGKDKDDAVGVR